MCIVLSCNWMLKEPEVDSIDKLICENNALVAPSVLNSWKTFHRERHPDKVQGFKLAFLSNYNWVKKCLEYPYNESDIHMEHIPIHHWGRRQAANAVVLSAIVLIGLIVVYSKVQNTAIQASALVGCVVVFSFLMYWVSDLIGKAGRK